MGLLDRLFFRQAYRKAGPRGEDVPWHRDEPHPLLAEAAVARAPGRAVDLGCGTGTHAVFLAQRGWKVTALDFTPRAVELARERAARAGVTLDARVADVLAFESAEPFDLVLDSGCLHGFAAAQRLEYKRRLLRSWLDQDGDYLLVHFGKVGPLDWRPIGPRRWSRERVEALFRPELRARKYVVDDRDVPLPMGPRIRIAEYWFVRANPAAD